MKSLPHACSAALILAFFQPASASDLIRLSKPVSESIKPDGIYWNFDNGTPGTSEPNPVRDESGNGFEGFLLRGVNGELPVYVEGKFGAGIHLKGEHPTAPDPRVSWKVQESSAGDETRLDMSGRSFTAGAWVKFNEIKSGESQTFVVFERGIAAAGNNAWSIRIAKPPNGKWRLRFQLSGAYQDAFGDAVNFSDGKWHHVAISLDQTETAGVLAFWFDGIPIREGVVVDTTIPPMNEKGRNRVFTVGERNVSHYYSDTDASVDEVFVTSGLYRFEP